MNVLILAFGLSLKSIQRLNIMEQSNNACSTHRNYSIELY